MSVKNLMAIIVEDWPAKALSLLAALFLMLAQRQNTMVRQYYDIPLEIKPNSGLVPAEELPGKIGIAVNVPGEDAAYISESNFIARIDLSGFNAPGTYKVPVEIQSRGHALYVDLLEAALSVNEISVILDNKETRTVPVTAVFKGAPAPGYEITKVTVRPPKVDITGPAVYLKTLHSLSTAPVDISGSSSNISKVAALENISSLLSASEQTFQVGAEVRKIIITEEYRDVPVLVKGLLSGFKVSRISGIKGDEGEAAPDGGGEEKPVPDTLTGTVVLKTAEADAGKAEFGEGFLFVDCSRIKGAGEYLLPVELNAVRSYDLVSYSPEYVRIEVVRIK